MKKSIAVILVLALALTSFSVSFAKIKNKRNFNRGEKIVQLLKLTDAQEAKFNELRFAHKSEVIDIETKIKKQRLAVQKMMITDNVDGSKLLEITGDISSFRAELVELRTKNWLAVYNILNDDQKELWKKNFSRMRGHFNDGFRDGSKGRFGKRDGADSHNGYENRDGSGQMGSKRNFRNN